MDRSDAATDVCREILKDYYGKTIADLITTTHRNYPRWFSFNEIYDVARDMQIPLTKLKEKLRDLIAHNFAECRKSNAKTTDYRILHNNILLVPKYPRYVAQAGKIFGEEAQLLIHNTLKEGQVYCSQAIVVSAAVKLSLSEKRKNVPLATEKAAQSLLKAMQKLAEHNYIIRCSLNDSEEPIEMLAKLLDTDVDMHLICNEIDIRKGHPGSQDSMLVQSHRDEKKFWKVNFDRFHVDFRDAEIRHMVIRDDPKFGTVFDKFMEFTKGSKTMEDDRFIKGPVNHTCLSLNFLDNYSLLDRFLRWCSSESLGPMIYKGEVAGDYYIDLLRAYEVLANRLIEDMVEVAFGTEGYEIYTTLKEHKVLDRDMINNYVLTSLRTTTRLLSRMDQECFVKTIEVPKPAGTFSNKMCYVFYKHEFEYTVRNIIDNRLYKKLRNSMIFRQKVMEENAKLIEKKSRAEALLQMLNEKQGNRIDADYNEEEEEKIKNALKDAVSKEEEEKFRKIHALNDTCLQNESTIMKHIDILKTYLKYLVSERLSRKKAQAKGATKKMFDSMA